MVGMPGSDGRSPFAYLSAASNYLEYPSLGATMLPFFVEEVARVENTRRAAPSKTQLRHMQKRQEQSVRCDKPTFMTTKSCK